MALTVSILTGGSNGHTETATSFNAFATDFISQGIVGGISSTAGVAPASGGMAVNAQSSPNNTTQVSAGVAYVRGTPSGSASQMLRVVDTTGATITHASNISGATRYDFIYLALDSAKMANPAADASDVASYFVSRSTLSSSDTGTPPAYGYLLAVVTVTNTFTTISNAQIADKRSSATTARTSTIDWSSLTNNMKYAYNAAQVNPVNGETDFASSASVSFTCVAPCQALVTVTLGIFSAGDFEFRPEVRLNGALYSQYSPNAASVGPGRASSRTFSIVVPLQAGVNVLSPGVFLGSGSSYQIVPGAMFISAFVLGNVTA